MTTSVQDINIVAKEIGAAKTLIVGHDSEGNSVALRLNSDGTMTVTAVGNTTAATADTIVMMDSDGTLFITKVSSDTPPVATHWTYPIIAPYTITGTPTPFGVQTVTVQGSVEVANDVDSPLPVAFAAIAGAYAEEISVVMAGAVADVDGGTSHEGALHTDATTKELKVANAKLVSDDPISVASSTTSVTLVAANANRRSLTIYNNSTATLFVCFQATATEASTKVPLSGKVNGIGGFYEMPSPIYVGEISGIWASANGNASIYEGV